MTKSVICCSLLGSQNSWRMKLVRVLWSLWKNTLASIDICHLYSMWWKVKSTWNFVIMKFLLCCSRKKNSEQAACTAQSALFSGLELHGIIHLMRQHPGDALIAMTKQDDMPAQVLRAFFLPSYSEDAAQKAKEARLMYNLKRFLTRVESKYLIFISSSRRRPDKLCHGAASVIEWPWDFISLPLSSSVLFIDDHLSYSAHGTLAQRIDLCFSGTACAKKILSIFGLLGEDVTHVLLILLFSGTEPHGLMLAWIIVPIQAHAQLHCWVLVCEKKYCKIMILQT